MANDVNQKPAPEEATGNSRWKRILGWFGGIRLGIGALWLVLLYATFSALVVFSLSAHQLHYAIKSFRAGDKPLAIWTVLQMHAEWKAAKVNLDSLSFTLSNLRWEVSRLQEKAGTLQSDILQKTIVCEREIKDFQQFVISKYPAFKRIDVRCFDAHLQEINRGAAEASASVIDLPEHREHEARAAALVDEVKSLSSQIGLNANTIEAFERRIVGTEEDIIALKGKMDKILKVDGTTVDVAIGDFLNSITYLENTEQGSWLAVVLPDFSQMPPDMLTLILVLAMGALGGTISLTRLYFRDGATDGEPEGRPSYYLFRPFLGAITALAVYILAKAGVLVISAPTSEGSGANLSPFFVSFLGIVSGLLAEQALDTIQRTGTNLFAEASTVGRSRWAHGLKEALGGNDAAKAAEFEAKKKDLADTIDVAQETMREWVEEEKAVPSPYQALIAAYLHMSPRNLFSDMRAGRQVNAVEAT